MVGKAVTIGSLLRCLFCQWSGRACFESKSIAPYLGSDTDARLTPLVWRLPTDDAAPLRLDTAMKTEDYITQPAPALALPSTSTPSTPTPRRLKSSTLFCRVLVAASLILITLYHHGGIMHLADTQSLSDYHSIFIPFINDFSSKHVPQVMCTVDGVDIHMPVDTGSTGTLIGAPLLPNIPPTTGTLAHHFFTSSRILYVGRLVELAMNFTGQGGSYATAVVPVLIVDKSWRCPWYDPLLTKIWPNH